jgi:phosphate/sulfate permease
MSAAQNRPSAIRTIVLAMIISSLTAAIIGCLLYYTLKRHELAHVQAIEQMAVEAQSQQAIAAGHVLGALSRHVIQDVTRLQELVNTGLDSEGLQDFLVVSRDNVVLAAKQTAQVGQRLQDPNWLAWKGQNREVVKRAVNQAGQPVLVIVQPLKDGGDILAWAMLVFALPQGAVFLASSTERLVETGQLMAPIFVVLLLSIGSAMKLAVTAIRRQIQGVMASLLEESAEPQGDDWLRKVS